MSSRYSKEFKLEAIKLAQQPGMNPAKAARDLGVGKSMIYKWINEASADAAQAFPGKGRLKARDEEIRSLRRENETLRMERDILKKAAAFFAKENH